MPLPTAELRAPLLRWYRRSRRDLPWRGTRDAYAVWVSEIMLQQTQVATVLPYYRRFMDRFPDPSALARADEEEVLALWSGLGYYRRARSLHSAALQIVESHGGRLPADVAALRKLPGIGRYTAGAIASIAFDLREPVLDGNVKRVLSRLLGRDAGEALLWETAGRLADGPHPGDLNQALMELGALICTPRSPGCARCPLAGGCRAHQEGRPEQFPAKRSAPAVQRVRVGVALALRAGRVLLERPAKVSPLRGTWDLPAREIAGDGPAEETLRHALAAGYGLEVRVMPRERKLSHGIMNRRLALLVHPCRLRRGRVAGRTDLRWLDLSRLEETAVSGATRKVLRGAGLVP